MATVGIRLCSRGSVILRYYVLPSHITETMVGAIRGFVTFAALAFAGRAEDSQCALQVTANNVTKANASKAKVNASEFVPIMIQRFLNRPAPHFNENVSEETPLVFMHQSRAGGTTIRKLLFNASHSAGLKAHIPCSGGVDCHSFSKVKKAAVYGGHFCWHELMGHLGANTKASCLTNFREPHARIMSCYTSRLVKEKKVAPGCMGKLAPEKLRSMLQNYGCVNEPFRRLGQCGLVSHVSTGDKLTQMQVWNATLEHLAQCVPVLVDRKDTFKAAVHHFPQFKSVFWAMKNVTLNQNQYMKDCQIPDTHKKVIAELAEHETMLYDAVKQRVLKLQKSL